MVTQTVEPTLVSLANRIRLNFRHAFLVNRALYGPFWPVYLYPTRRRLRGSERRAQPLTREITDILICERGMVADQDGWIFPNPPSESALIDSMKKAFKRCVV